MPRKVAREERRVHGNGPPRGGGLPRLQIDDLVDEQERIAMGQDVFGLRVAHSGVDASGMGLMADGSSRFGQMAVRPPSTAIAEPVR